MPELDATGRLPPEPGVVAAATTQISLPAGFICPQCDYDLGSASVQVCSECGREVVPDDIAAFRLAQTGGEELRHRIRRWRNFSAIFVAALTLASLVLVADLVTSLVVAVVSALVMLGSFAIGWFAALLAPKPNRFAIRWAWMSALPWLIAPWLMVPVVAIAGAVLISIFISPPRDDPWPAMGASMLALPVMGVWLLVSLGSAIVGARVLAIDLDEQRVPRRAWRPHVAIASLIVIVGALLAGFVGAGYAWELVTDVVCR